MFIFETATIQGGPLLLEIGWKNPTYRTSNPIYNWYTQGAHLVRIFKLFSLNTAPCLFHTSFFASSTCRVGHQKEQKHGEIKGTRRCQWLIISLSLGEYSCKKVWRCKYIYISFLGENCFVKIPQFALSLSLSVWKKIFIPPVNRQQSSWKGRNSHKWTSILSSF